MIYLASPYSPVTPEEKLHENETRELRYRQTMAAQAMLFNYGYPVFATIVHTHCTAKAYKLPTDAGPWMRYNHHMIDLSMAVFVLQLPGWEQSRGVTDEIDYANKHNIPVYPIGVVTGNIDIKFAIPILPELQTLLRVRDRVHMKNESVPFVPEALA